MLTEQNVHTTTERERKAMWILGKSSNLFNSKMEIDAVYDMIDWESFFRWFSCIFGI